MKTAIVDVDEPTLGLISAWLQAYNEDWNDNLEKQEITDWDLSKFVKPECGKKIYDYLKDPHLYDNVFPTPLAHAGITELRNMGFRVVYVTASTIEQSGKKFQRLKDFNFIESQNDYVEMTDKSLIKGDVMLDDGFHNVNVFGGVGVLWNASWNKDFDWKIRVNNWYQFIDIAKKLKDNY